MSIEKSETMDVDAVLAKAGIGESDGQLSTGSETTATVQPAPPPPPDLASHQHILDRFKVAIRGCGVVGEDATACIAYLVLTSRLLDKQASLAIKGNSASGKSYTLEQTLRFFPADAVITMTGMSEHALVFKPESYRHKTLVVYEATALREGQQDNQTAYFVRTLLSEGRIDYDVTVRGGEDGFTTKHIHKEGPTNLILTTTATSVHAENETRVLSVTTNDSQDQTRKVLAQLADETDHAAADLEPWVALQVWLATQPNHVTIPYAKELAAQVPPVAVRLRRDFGTLLALVRAHALLHRQTREVDGEGRVVARVDDYETVRKLVDPVIAAGVGRTVPETVSATVAAVERLEEFAAFGATAQQVAASLELDKSAAWRRLRTAEELGYVVNVEDRRGQPGRWKVGEPLPKSSALLPVLQPQPVETDGATAESAGQSPSEGAGCTVAGESEGIEDELPF